MLMNILPFVHQCLASVIQAGDHVIDATAGNGYDTVFLAELVGQHGSVLAFDIQDQALQQTRRRLEAANLSRQVELIRDGHEHLGRYARKDTRVVMFNCGYLPGGEKTITTNTSTSLQALQAALAVIATGGLVSVVLYPGHEEGRRETEAILSWAEHLPQNQVAVLRYGFINRLHHAPFALILEKLVSF